MNKQKIKPFLELLVVFSVCVAASVHYFSMERGGPDSLLNGGDQIAYNYLAGQLLHDRIYAENWPLEDNYRAWRPPGYPIFLALLLWLGQNDLQFVISVQYLLLVLTGLAVFYLGSKTSHSFLGGLLACIAFYSFAPFGYYASVILSETLFMFGLCCFLIFLSEGLRTERAVFYICAGCSLGLSTLVRTIALPFLGAGILLLVVGWIVLSAPKHILMLTRLRRVNPEPVLNEADGRACHRCGRVEALPGGYFTQVPRLRNLSLLIVCAWLVVIPITLRNYLVLHAFVPVATADGMLFYFGTKSSLNWDKEHETTVNPLRKEFREVGSRNRLIKLAVETISISPGEYLIHKAKTIGKYVVPNLHYMDFLHLPCFFHYSGKAERAVHVLFLIGCLTLVVGRDLWSWAFLLSYGGLVVSSALANFFVRYVAVTLPLYFIICACGVTGMLNGTWRVAGRVFHNDQNKQISKPFGRI